MLQFFDDTNERAWEKKQTCPTMTAIATNSILHVWAILLQHVTWTTHSTYTQLNTDCDIGNEEEAEEEDTKHTKHSKQDHRSVVSAQHEDTL